MNYTTKKQSIIFELPLYGYFGSSRGKRADGVSYNNFIGSIQGKEEEFFLNSDYGYDMVNGETIDDKKPEAIEYLKTLPGKYTDEELDLFDDELKNDIRRALADSYNQSYQDEWLTKYFKITQDKINEDLTDALDGISYKLLDRVDDDEFKRTRTDQEFLRLEISKDAIKKYLTKDNPEALKYSAKEWPEYFADYALDFERKEINIEYVDYYNSMGDFDDWLDCFKDYQEIISTIDKYREEESTKINNFEAMALNLKPSFEAINSYTEKYINQEPGKSKIKRQIGALKSVIKNAV